MYASETVARFVDWHNHQVEEEVFKKIIICFKSALVLI